MLELSLQLLDPLPEGLTLRGECLDLRGPQAIIARQFEEPVDDRPPEILVVQPTRSLCGAARQHRFRILETDRIR
jgi:hypothetical protein